MKTPLLLVATLVLSGCATSLDELVREAGRTGDWSAVEQREWLNDRRAADNIPMLAGACGARHIAVVSTSGAPRCERGDVLERVLTPRTGSAIR
ncbi:MAG: hypothetical protein AAFS02_06850 [Pseudomonadota bacterium]